MNFDTVCNKIKNAHRSIGHKLGWRFLYSPRRTYKKDIDLLLLGVNPGGGCPERVIRSVERGNAYRVEHWNGNGFSGLQKQIQKFFDLVCPAFALSQDELMDRTLTANFCPFRSPNLNKLHEPEKSVRFSQKLWKDILQFIRPRVVVCNGNLPYEQVRTLLLGMGCSEAAANHYKTGWGTIRARSSIMNIGKTSTLLVGLPHLSRFAIFGRKKSVVFEGLLLKMIQTHLKKNRRLKRSPISVSGQ